VEDLLVVFRTCALLCATVVGERLAQSRQAGCTTVTASASVNGMCSSFYSFGFLS
jgi:hypothetical protein